MTGNGVADPRIVRVRGASARGPIQVEDLLCLD